MKKLKQVYIVYTFVLFMFIAYSISVILEFSELHGINEKDYSFNSIISTLSYYSIYWPLLYLLIPVLAVLYKSKLSWFILVSFFYLLICNIITVSYFDFKFESKEFDIFFILTIISFSIIPTTSIYILNRQKTYKNVYGIEKKSIMLYNLVGFIVGCGLSLLLFIKRYSIYYNDLQF